MAIQIKNISELHAIFLQSNGISTDTRKITENSLFFCLQGENFNGNSFAKEALSKGAAYAVIDEAEFDEGERCILVENTLHALQKLALFHRSHFQIPVIGITGTNGKTTTKELVHAVLSKKFRVQATQGNLNNHIGVPLTLLGIKADTEIAVVEMGANHLHEIAELCEIARPDFGLITSIGKAHLEGFGDLEGVIKTKSELYQYIHRYGKLVFVNANDSLLWTLSAEQERYSFGDDGQANIQAQLLPNNGYVQLSWQNQIVNSQLVGDYNYSNLLAAITIGFYFGVNQIDIIQAIAEYTPKNQRSQLLVKGSNTIVLDAYNANPTSMQAALTSLKTAQFAHKSVILGDMLELGKESENEHLEIINILKSMDLDHVILVGPIFSSIEHPFLKFHENTELLQFLNTFSFQNQYILIKGSRGIRLETIIEAL